MAEKNRIFISFAIEDARCRDLLKGQAKNDKSPFEFVDMSVKEPWDEQWKTRCRTKIKGCDGMIALVSKKTANADGALWEVKCGKEELETSRIRGIYVDSNNKPSSLPAEFAGIRVVEWTWPNIKSFLDSL